MWNLRKRLFALLLVLLFVSQLALAQATSSTSSTTQEVQIDLSNFLGQDMFLPQSSTKNLNEESKNSMTSQQQSTESQTASQTAATLLNNQDLLLDSLEEQWKSLELQVQTLEIRSDKLEKDNVILKSGLENSKKTISSLKENLKNYRAALISNKDDTSYIVGLFAEAQAEIESIKTYVAKLENDKRHLKNARVISVSCAAAGAGTLILANTVPMDQRVKDFLSGLGGGLTVSGALTFAGSFVF